MSENVLLFYKYRACLCSPVAFKLVFGPLFHATASIEQQRSFKALKMWSILQVFTIFKFYFGYIVQKWGQPPFVVGSVKARTAWTKDCFSKLGCISTYSELGEWRSSRHYHRCNRTRIQTWTSRKENCFGKFNAGFRRLIRRSSWSFWCTTNLCMLHGEK